MPASEYAYPSSDPEGHPATRDFVEHQGQRQRRHAGEAAVRIAQLSEIAHGEGDESVKRFTVTQQKPTHDHGPDS